MVLFDSQGTYLIPPELPLTTRKGSQIPNKQRNQRVPQAMQAAKAIMEKIHPSVRARSLSSIYNCMGMVFAARRTRVDPEHLEMMLADDEYRRVPDERHLERGDIVVYRDTEWKVSHVGVVVKVKPDLRTTSEASWEVTVLSQWGADGEYFHLADSVHPSLGKPVEYWTDRT